VGFQMFADRGDSVRLLVRGVWYEESVLVPRDGDGKVICVGWVCVLFEVVRIRSINERRRCVVEIVRSVAFRGW
jgi:hypothetical protein